MYAISIKDEELLPVSKQIDLLDSKSKNSTGIASGSEFERLKKQLNRDFTRKVISLSDFISLSLRLSKHSSTQDLIL